MQKLKELLEVVDMQIYALTETIEKAKGLGVAIGHKRVYSRVKLLGEYNGRLIAYKEMKETIELMLKE